MRPAHEPSTPPETKVAPVRPPRRTLIGWVIVLPLLLLVGLLAQPGSLPPQVNTPPQAAEPTPIPAADEMATEATPIPQPATHKQPTPTADKLRSYTIYVPGPDALLHRKVVQDHTSATNDPERQAEANSGTSESLYTNRLRHALTLLFKDADNLFPRGTRPPQVGLKGDNVTVDFPAGLQKSSLWHSEKIAQLAVYSIVQTLNADDSSATKHPVKVQFLENGKPLDALGELDVSEPLEPNPQLVAQS